jgi:hypothetical protein
MSGSVGVSLPIYSTLSCLVRWCIPWKMALVGCHLFHLRWQAISADRGHEYCECSADVSEANAISPVSVPMTPSCVSKATNKILTALPVLKACVQEGRGGSSNDFS